MKGYVGPSADNKIMGIMGNNHRLWWGTPCSMIDRKAYLNEVIVAIVVPNL